MNKQAMEAWRRALALLKGATIVRTGCDDQFPWFEVQWPDGTKAEFAISRDDEGNGPGALLGLWELVEEKAKR